MLTQAVSTGQQEINALTQTVSAGCQEVQAKEAILIYKENEIELKQQKIVRQVQELSQKEDELKIKTSDISALKSKNSELKKALEESKARELKLTAELKEAQRRQPMPSPQKSLTPNSPTGGRGLFDNPLPKPNINSPKPLQVPKDDATKKDVSLLLKWVTEGHLIEVENLLKKNRELALMTGTVTDLSERTFNNITGFQYAVWALDIAMWNLILKYLDNATALFQLQSIEAAPEKYSRHGAHYNITPLITKTREYLDNLDKWDYKKCCQYWQKEVGGEQRKCPAWLIYTWCEKGKDVAWVKKI